MTTHTVIGQSLPRVDARDKVTGQAAYGVDVQLPGQTYMRILGSPHAHAEILSIDASKAEALPGVVGVITAKDLPAGVELNASSRGHMFLARDKVFFMGQTVAAVAALDMHTAEAALALIDVKYRPLGVVGNVMDAIKPDAPIIQHEGEVASDLSIHNAEAGDRKSEEMEDIGDSDIREAAELAEANKAPVEPSYRNISSHIVFKQGDVANGFAEADFITEHTYSMPWVHQGYLEPQNATASWDPINQQLTLWISTQGQFYERQHVSETLGLPVHKVKVIAPEVGGGFGGKLGLIGPLVGLMAMKCGRPVKLIYTRHEELQATNPAPASVIQLKTGVKKDGTLTAIDAKVFVDTGAYSGSPMSIICVMLAAPYKFPNLLIDGYEVYTNKASAASYRAPGGPNVTSAIEQQIDIMAAHVGMSPLQFRMLNGSEEGVMRPDGTPQPKIGLKAVLNEIAKHPIWKEPLGPNQGRGLAIGGWGGGRGPASAFVKLEADGTFEVIVGTVELTGANTSFAQIAAEALGVPVNKIRVTRADTETAPYGPVAGGSQVVYSMGVAIIRACDDAKAQIVRIAAKDFETTEDQVTFDAVGVHTRDGEKSRSWLQFYEHTSGWTAKSAPVLGRGAAERRKGAPGYAATVADVEVDPESGVVKVLRIVTAQDVGKAINRMSVEGQIQGGTVQGVGAALWEEIMFNKDGRVLNASLLDYRKATARDLPFVDTIIVEQPSEDGPFGAKIVGEPSIVPPVGAIANAVANATGARVYDFPLTPERIIRAMGKVEKYDMMTTVAAPAPAPKPKPVGRRAAKPAPRKTAAKTKPKAKAKSAARRRSR